MTNIYKDDEEENKKLETICKYLRPEVFLKKEEEQETFDFIESIEEKLGRKLTEEELSKINEEREVDNNDIDIIEHLEE